MSDTVLVVDDDDGVRGVLARLVKKHGGTSVALDSGAKAIQAISFMEEMPAVILLDVLLPDRGLMCGDIIRTFREKFPRVYIVGMSGHTREYHEKNHHPLEGLDFFVCKDDGFFPQMQDILTVQLSVAKA